MTTPQKLWGEALRAAVPPWKEELGKSDRERLDSLLGLSTREDIKLSDCLKALFPGDDTQKAQTALTSFRKRLNDAASGEGRTDLGLRFHVDTKKKNPPADRICWFTGPDPAMAQAEDFSRRLTDDIQDKPLIISKGIATTGTALAEGKRVIRLFVSYAHEDKKYFDEIIKQLRIRFASSKNYELQAWTDQDIPLGVGWKERIQKAIDECQFGLLLLSPAFLASDFIGKQELPHFVGGLEETKRIKPVLPVGVVPVSFQHQNLQGLQDYQVFRYRSAQTEGRFFGQMNGTQKKQEFIQQLYLAIEKRLNDYYAPSTSSGSPSPPRGKEHCTADTLAEQIPIPEATRHYQPSPFRRFKLGELEQFDRPGHEMAPEQSSDAISELQSWATNSEAPPFFALLGEYGIGKTTTLKQLTRCLLEERRSNPKLPLPIYVDLRDYIGESRDSLPTIDQLLDSVIQRSWKLHDRSLRAHDLLRLVREEGALLIFDGLDEKIVHLPPSRAREFIRTLWAALPDAARPAVPEVQRGKLLVSCRAHYFRDVWSQNSMLVGEDREGINRQGFPALCLLPFTESQIRAYLKSLLGEEGSANQAFDLIASIHNLQDLAQRPYLLSLIGGQLGALEAVKARGETVNAARLYDLVVHSWLRRDDGKHQIDPAHKRRLMEDLAAALWREDRKQWDADRLELWFDEALADSPTLNSVYANKDRSTLKEDLRTATFVLRGTTDEKDFRFAHTSLQEYFLAAYLLRALDDGRLGCWDLPEVSMETLDFLGDLLALDSKLRPLRALEELLSGEHPRAAVLAFAYWMRAVERGHPTPSPKKINLSGANLEKWRVRGRSPTQPLNLRGADLSKTNLNQARLEFVDISDANLSESQARQSLFINVSALRIKATGSDWSGMKWRKGSLASADLCNVRLKECQLIHVKLDGTRLTEGWEHQATVLDNQPLKSSPQKEDLAFSVGVGHSSFIKACAWSPDGQRLSSGSIDNTVKVWSATSGVCILTLKGHVNRVNDCAWSPDGERLLSCSDDNTIKIWDAISGTCLFTIQGHEGGVNDCAWSLDGERLLSCSDDNTIKIWDAISGTCLFTIQGHEEGVNACAWSPDGGRILSCSDDDTIKIWDAKSTDCLLTIEVQAGGVSSCAWSPDGQRIMSGLFDETVRVWDAASGTCVLTLLEHTGGASSCAWSPDGQRLLSSSFDDDLLNVWDANSGVCLLTLFGHTDGMHACAWSPDGQFLLSGSYDDTLKVWDATSGACLLTLEGYAGAVRTCLWNPSGQLLLSGSDEDALRIWDATSGACLVTLAENAGRVSTCAWSPDGQRLLSGYDNNTLKVWDITSNTCLLILLGHTDGVSTCAWSPDGQRLLSGSFDNTLKIWDATSGACLTTFEGHERWMRDCAWSPDGQRILSCSDDNALKVWSATSNACLLILAGHTSRLRTCAWSPDGQRLLSGSTDTTLKIWDATSGICLRTLTGHTGSVNACAWSPDGQRLLSGSTDTTLKIWDATSGICLRTLTGHTGSVNACAWSPDGQRLLSGSTDTTFGVWDATSGLCLWLGQYLPEKQFVSLDVQSERVLHASEEAWRWLNWRWTNPTTGQVRMLPAEALGPLPT